MKDKLNAIKRKLDRPVVRHLIVYSAGVAMGSAATLHFIKSGRSPHILDLSGEAYHALINDETNFVRFTGPEHVFLVTLES